MTPSRDPDPYRSLIRAVIFQQLSGKAATTILNRFLALDPDHPFPRPDFVIAAEPETLRAVGLSRQKIAALKDIAARKAAGLIPDVETLADMEDDAIVAALSQARGVGRWTVEMHLIFGMARPDVLPVDDLGVRRGVERLYGESLTPKELAVFGERWRPWRSAAAWHLWRVADTVTPTPT